MNFEAQPGEAMAEKELNEKELAIVREAIAFLWRNIGKNVRRLREARGLTQELLAEMTGRGKFGISVRTIARLEAGQRVSDETLKAIAGALNVSLDTLSEIEEREPAVTEDEERKLVRELIGGEEARCDSSDASASRPRRSRLDRFAERDPRLRFSLRPALERGRRGCHRPIFRRAGRLGAVLG